MIKNTLTKKNSTTIDMFYDTTDAYKLFLNEVGKYPLLSAEKEIELAKRIREGDKEAKDMMVNSNMRLVLKMAHMYYKEYHQLELLDYVSAGSIGLIRAVEKFDPEKGFRFSTYATCWIKQAMKRACNNEDSTIRIPVHMQEKISKVRKITQMLNREFGYEPSPEEIADELCWSMNQLEEVYSAMGQLITTSTFLPIGEKGDTELGEIIPDPNAVNPEEAGIEEAANETLYEVLKLALNEKEYRVITLRFGLGGEDACTLEEVGQEFGVTRERIRQIEQHAIKKLGQSKYRRVLVDLLP